MEDRVALRALETAGDGGSRVQPVLDRPGQKIFPVGRCRSNNRMARRLARLSESLLAAINRRATRLNREAREVLDYQIPI
jgi:hypothetical protein